MIRIYGSAPLDIFVFSLFSFVFLFFILFFSPLLRTGIRRDLFHAGASLSPAFAPTTTDSPLINVLGMCAALLLGNRYGNNVR